MADGRTIWYSEDASYVHRGRIVMLVQEMGGLVLATMMVLRGEAKLQNDGGRVLSGFPTVSRNGGLNDLALTRHIVERAAVIGELDDLEILDEVRFRCRISGWAADQERAATAERVRRHRASNGVKRSVTVGNEDHTEQNRDNDSLRSSLRRSDHDDEDDGNAASRPQQPERATASAAPLPPEPNAQPAAAQPSPQDVPPTAAEAPLCHLLADLVVQNGGRRPRIGKTWTDAERLLLERDKRPRAEAERLLRWSQANEFWRSVILSMVKFREKYDTIRLQEKAKRGVAVERSAPSSAQLVNARPA